MAATTLTRRAAALSLIAAPPLGLAATQVWPDNPADPAARLGVIAASSDRYLAGNLITLLVIVLFVPAVLALVRVLRARRTRLSRVGSALAALGIVGWSGTTAISAVELEMAKGGDRAAMVALADRIQSSVVPGVFLVMFLLGLFIALLVLAIGLWRAGVAPAWVPAAVVVAVALDVVASTEQFAVALVWTLLTAALGWIGVRILQSSDEEWERASIAARPPRRRSPADASVGALSE